MSGDISHSSVERVIGPDATILMDFMLGRFTGLMEKLVVYPERMLSNLNMTHGVIFSQMVLLRLIDKGMTREQGYAVSPEECHDVLAGGAVLSGLHDEGKPGYVSLTERV